MGDTGDGDRSRVKSSIKSASHLAKFITAGGLIAFAGLWFSSCDHAWIPAHYCRCSLKGETILKAGAKSPFEARVGDWETFSIENPPNSSYQQQYHWFLIATNNSIQQIPFTNNEKLAETKTNFRFQDGSSLAEGSYDVLLTIQANGCPYPKNLYARLNLKSDPEQPSTSRVPSSQTTPTVPKEPAIEAPNPIKPTFFVKSYLESIKRHDYDTAFNLLTPTYLRYKSNVLRHSPIVSLLLFEQQDLGVKRDAQGREFQRIYYDYEEADIGTPQSFQAMVIVPFNYRLKCEILSAGNQWIACPAGKYRNYQTGQIALVPDQISGWKVYQFCNSPTSNGKGCGEIDYANYWY